MNNEENMRIKNAMEFYMLANNLKYIMNKNGESIADQAYGSMILATAINSEYNIVNNLGKTIRMILLGAINKHYHEELVEIFPKMNSGVNYAIDAFDYYTFKDFGR